MQITVRLKGPLSRYSGGSAIVGVELDEATTTVRKILDQFSIPASSVSFAQVNNIKTDLDQFVKGGDTITFNPRVAGG